MQACSFFSTTTQRHRPLRVAADMQVYWSVLPCRRCFQRPYSATLVPRIQYGRTGRCDEWWMRSFDFRADEIGRFAGSGMKVRGHCLVWDHNNPQWLADGPSRATVALAAGTYHHE
jgi:hypothetical protein